jgi:hypothetical protein
MEGWIMATASERRRARSAKRAATPLATKGIGGGLKAAVHVAASLERETKTDRHGDDVMVHKYPGQDSVGYSYFVKKVYVDQFGNLVANAGCQSGVFVCSAQELPAFAAFLNSLQASF